jgi:hypothetical protein
MQSGRLQRLANGDELYHMTLAAFMLTMQPKVWDERAKGQSNKIISSREELIWIRDLERDFSV